MTTDFINQIKQERVALFTVLSTAAREPRCFREKKLEAVVKAKTEDLQLLYVDFQKAFSKFIDMLLGGL